jgi:hypothetical protein
LNSLAESTVPWAFIVTIVKIPSGDSLTPNIELMGKIFRM